MTIDTIDTSEQASPTASACPFHGVGAEYQPLSPAHVANPYPFYARAQREEPAFFSPALNCWVLTRYEDVSAALRDHRRFSSAGVFQSAVEYAPETRAILSQGMPFLVHGLINNDPPYHTRLRSSVSKVFSARRVASFEPRVRAIVDRMLNQFIAGGPGDIVARFNYFTPAAVIDEIIGVPEADLRQVIGWCQDTIALLLAPLPVEQQIACARSMIAYQRYLIDMIERRRAEPRDDLTSDLIRAIDSGEIELSMEELVELLFDLVVAGHETTANLLGSCLAHLLPNRALWKAIQEDPQLLRNVIEESMRFDGPAIGFFRMATEPVAIGGAEIPRGALVFLLYGAANHDAAQFPSPHVFDPHRENAARHLSFGAGIHFCLGAPLARLEMRVALEALTARLPNLRLTAGQELSYRPNLSVRGLAQLLVEWD